MDAILHCHSNKKAIYESIKSFRDFYPNSIIAIGLDGKDSDNFDDLVAYFGNINIVRYEENILPKGRFRDRMPCYASEYAKRIKELSNMVSNDNCVLLEDDVIFSREVNLDYFCFDAVGPIGPIISYKMIDYICEYCRVRGMSLPSATYYGFCGGTVFKTSKMQKMNIDFDFTTFSKLDNRMCDATDIVLTVLFYLNGYSYSSWSEYSDYSLSTFDKNAAIWHPVKDYYNK